MKRNKRTRKPSRELFTARRQLAVATAAVPLVLTFAAIPARADEIPALAIDLRCTPIPEEIGGVAPSTFVSLFSEVGALDGPEPPDFDCPADGEEDYTFMDGIRVYPRVDSEYYPGYPEYCYYPAAKGEVSAKEYYCDYYYDYYLSDLELNQEPNGMGVASDYYYGGDSLAYYRERSAADIEAAAGNDVSIQSDHEGLIGAGETLCLVVGDTPMDGGEYGLCSIDSSIIPPRETTRVSGVWLGDVSCDTDGTITIFHENSSGFEVETDFDISDEIEDSEICEEGPVDDAMELSVDPSLTVDATDFSDGGEFFIKFDTPLDMHHARFDGPEAAFCGVLMDSGPQTGVRRPGAPALVEEEDAPCGPADFEDSGYLVIGFENTESIDDPDGPCEITEDDEASCDVGGGITLNIPTDEGDLTTALRMVPDDREHCNMDVPYTPGLPGLTLNFTLDDPGSAFGEEFVYGPSFPPWKCGIPLLEDGTPVPRGTPDSQAFIKILDVDFDGTFDGSAEIIIEDAFPFECTSPSPYFKPLMQRNSKAGEAAQVLEYGDETDYPPSFFPWLPYIDENSIASLAQPINVQPCDSFRGRSRNFSLISYNTRYIPGAPLQDELLERIQRFYKAVDDAGTANGGMCLMPKYEDYLKAQHAEMELWAGLGFYEPVLSTVIRLLDDVNVPNFKTVLDDCYYDPTTRTNEEAATPDSIDAKLDEDLNDQLLTLKWLLEDILGVTL